MKTNEELYIIANDIVEGKIFSMFDSKEPNIFLLSFPLIGLLSLEDIEKMKINEIFIYEYLEKAEPRCINGNPIFMSFSYLDKEEFAILTKMIEKIIKGKKDTKNEILGL